MTHLSELASRTRLEGTSLSNTMRTISAGLVTRGIAAFRARWHSGWILSTCSAASSGWTSSECSLDNRRDHAHGANLSAHSLYFYCSHNGNASGMTIIEGTGNMWILDSFLRDRELVSPSSEETSVWPHTTQTNQVIFLTDMFDRMREEILRSVAALPLEMVPVDKIGHLQVTSKVAGFDGEAALSIAVCRSFTMLPQLISPFAEVHDIDTQQRAEECDSWACVAFCSYRFDDIQHLIVGLKDGRVHWQACTVEEDFITTKRMSATTLRFRIHKTVFLFDVNSSMLASSQIEPLAHMLSLFFRFLPDDIVRLIAINVHSGATRVSVRRFNRGSSLGVFNYATARLLRMAYIMNGDKRIQTGKVPTLLQFRDMNHQERHAIYPMLKCAMRRRHQTFSRHVRTKHTRSGMVY